MLLHLSEVEREIAISKCCTRAAEETQQSYTAHHGANGRAAMGRESKANSVCLSKWFARLTPSIVKAHLISQPFILLSAMNSI